MVGFGTDHPQVSRRGDYEWVAGNSRYGSPETTMYGRRAGNGDTYRFPVSAQRRRTRRSLPQ